MSCGVEELDVEGSMRRVVVKLHAGQVFGVVEEA